MRVCVSDCVCVCVQVCVLLFDINWKCACNGIRTYIFVISRCQKYFGFKALITSLLLDIYMYVHIHVHINNCAFLNNLLPSLKRTLFKCMWLNVSNVAMFGILYKCNYLLVKVVVATSARLSNALFTKSLFHH